MLPEETDYRNRRNLLLFLLSIWGENLDKRATVLIRVTRVTGQGTGKLVPFHREKMTKASHFKC